MSVPDPEVGHAIKEHRLVNTFSCERLIRNLPQTLVTLKLFASPNALLETPDFPSKNMVRSPARVVLP